MDERKKFFANEAEEWDKELTAEDLEVVSFLIDSFGIKRGDKIVDLGCGTGVLFDMLRRKVGSEGTVIGVDFCPNMLDRAKRNFPFENVYEINADVGQLPLEKESFNMAACFAAFAHFTDPKAVMQEISRVLTRGAQFHIIHLMGSGKFEEYHRRQGGPLANDQLPTLEDMMHLFRLGHFTNIKIQDHPGLYLASGTKE
ncbi:MAG: methyltransferase domain-containing protein [Candidatus Zixiibacteriota bacterium]